MDRRLLDLDHLGAGRGELAKLEVHRAGHVPDQLLLVLEVVLGGVAVEEDREHLRRAGPELDRLARARARLGDPPQLGVLERIARVVLDLADDARPAPGRLDLVHQRPGRELEQPVARALVLELLVLEALPALQRVVVPRAAGEVLVEVVVAVGEDVEPRALLLGDHGRVCVEELLAETDVEQRRVERPAPQAAVIPARPRPRAGDGRREHQVLGGREHRACASSSRSGDASMLDRRSGETGSICTRHGQRPRGGALTTRPIGSTFGGMSWGTPSVTGDAIRKALGPDDPKGKSEQQMARDAADLRELERAESSGEAPAIPETAATVASEGGPSSIDSRSAAAAPRASQRPALRLEQPPVAL